MKAMKKVVTLDVDADDSDIDNESGSSHDTEGSNMSRDKNTAAWFKQHESELSPAPWFSYNVSGCFLHVRSNLLCVYNVRMHSKVHIHEYNTQTFPYACMT